VSKTPEEIEADMEAGMTTAERRRRRRRGGGLRVPSDNVPRRNSSPAVAAVPDDPSIAIAYTTNGAEPISSVHVQALDPIAPEAASTLIDPPTDQPIEEVSFESKTREMSAVDLEALGLTDAEVRQEIKRVSAELTVSASTVVVDDDLLIGPPESKPQAMVVAIAPPRSTDAAVPSADAVSPIPAPSSPMPAVVAPKLAPAQPPMVLVPVEPDFAPQAPAMASTSPGHPPPPQPPPPLKLQPSAHEHSAADGAETPQFPSVVALAPPIVAAASFPQLPLSPEDSSESSPAAVEEPPPRPPHVIKGRAPTLALSEDDLEEFLEESRIDRQDRQAASEDTGEFEVDVEVEAAAFPTSDASEFSAVPERIVEQGEVSERVERTPERPSVSQLASPLLAGEFTARAKTISVPPPTPAVAAATAHAAPAVRTSPPPAPAKPPPAPPKKAPDKRVAAVAAAAQPEQDRKPRSKAWFAEVFDEDYLRTLPFLTPQATQAEAEFVASSLGTSPGAKLLDVGCGYGRHAMELAARGYHVVGLDLSTPLLVRGGEEAHRRGLTINFIRGDMRELDFDGQFDGAYCLFSTFGYFDDETNKKTAGNIARALRPGGKCVFEILNRDYVIADLPTRVWWEGDGCVVLEEVDFNYFSSRICVNRSVVFDDGRQLEQEISIRAYSLHEVGKLMLAAGFRVLEISGSYQTRARFFGNQSRHIIVVAERTG
jgi:SAM-dependent methyltransferase